MAISETSVEIVITYNRGFSWLVNPKKTVLNAIRDVAMATKFWPK